MMKRLSLLLVLVLCGAGSGYTQQSELPDKPDIWVNKLTLQSDSKAKHIGADSFFLGISTVTPLPELKTLKVGEKVSGITIGAIRCSFFTKDGSYGGEQFAWQGRWACMAGRSKEEIENAVGDNGEKNYDYIHIAPVGPE